MLKRNLAILIGAGLLGANVNLAVAQNAIPQSTDESNHLMTPAMDQYHARHEEALKREGSQAGWQATFPRSTDEYYFQTLPAAEQYHKQRQAAIQAESVSARTVSVGEATKYINVAHMETVRIVNGKGQSFVWTANTLGRADVPLKSIAPANFDAGQARVFVEHPTAHLPNS